MFEIDKIDFIRREIKRVSPSKELIYLVILRLKMDIASLKAYFNSPFKMNNGTLKHFLQERIFVLYQTIEK